MPLTTTIGGAESDSYVTLAEFLAYATSMGRPEVDAKSDLDRESSLRRAARAIDDRYAYRGFRYYQTQALAWPRVEVGWVHGWEVRTDTIPADIKRAQIEMALAIMGGTDPLPVSDGVIASESSSVGPISESVTYFGGKGRPAIPAVERILLPYLSAGAGVAQVMRS